MKKKIIVLTMGDPGGIGPEVTLKALASSKLKKIIRQKKEDVCFILLGNAAIYSRNNTLAKTKHTFNPIPCLDKKYLSSRALNILDLGDDPSEVQIGKISLANAVLAFHSLEVGAYCAREKVVDALVTAPICKEAMKILSPSFTGHTEYLAHMSGRKKFAMMLEGKGLRVVVVTTHVPLHKVSSLISKSTILEKIEIAHNFLRRTAKIRHPKVAVCALNPHAGEGGKIGTEEIDIIIPAIKAARRKGYNAIGPLPADQVFHSALQGTYDIVIAMFHDQGLGPLKAVAFDDGVNITLNLPFVRTSPDHGTAFDIAYKNKANPTSMLFAILSALKLS